MLTNTKHIEALQLLLSSRHPQEHNCEICGYTASSKNVLKGHTTRNHKVEVFRINEFDVSLKFSDTEKL